MTITFVNYFTDGYIWEDLFYVLNHNRVGKLRKRSSPLRDSEWCVNERYDKLLFFLILPIVFYIYFILVNIISSSCFHGTVNLSLTHNAVNSSNSLRDTCCTMLHNASCLWNGQCTSCRMHDARCQHRIFRMNTGQCMVS